MKHKFFTLILVAAITYANTLAQPTFQKLAKGNGRTHLNRVSKTTDGFIHVGQLLDNKNLVVTKFDKSFNIDWMHFFSDSLHTDYGLANITQVDDGGYIVSTTAPLLVFKLNRAGNIAWSQKINFSSASDYILTSKQDMTYSNDGTVVITGLMSEKSSPGINFPFVLKINSANGSIVWLKKLSFKHSTGNSLESYNIKQTHDGSYIICGSAEFDPQWHIKSRAFLALLDKNGDVRWSKIYRVEIYCVLSTVAETLDGGYIACGTYMHHPGGSTSFRLMSIIKFDAEGNIEWNKISFGGQLSKGRPFITSTGIITNADTSYTIVGYNTSGRRKFIDGYPFDRPYTVATVMTVNKKGKFIRERTVGAGERHKPVLFRDIIAMDSGFISAGDYSTEGNKTYLLLASFDNNGNTCSQNVHTPDVLDDPYELLNRSVVSQNITSSITAASCSLSRDTGHKSIFTLCSSESLNSTALLNSNGEANNNMVPARDFGKNNNFTIYPNPAKDILHVQIKNTATVSLTDQSGKILLTKIITGNDIINTANLKPGLYYLKNNTTGAVRKLIVSR